MHDKEWALDGAAVGGGPALAETERKGHGQKGLVTSDDQGATGLVFLPKSGFVAQLLCLLGERLE